LGKTHANRQGSPQCWFPLYFTPIRAGKIKGPQILPGSPADSLDPDELVWNAAGRPAISRALV
jgi:hypothetical protein